MTSDSIYDHLRAMRTIFLAVLQPVTKRIFHQQLIQMHIICAVLARKNR